MTTTSNQRCHQCGAEAPSGAQFCPACGLRLSLEPGHLPSPLPPSRWGGRKVVLWFLAIVLGLGALFLLGTIYFIRHTAIITSNKSGGRVEAPFGVVSTGNDPAKVARANGIEVYPGAVGERVAQADIGSNTIAALSFRTKDTPRQVTVFYHVRLPDATVREQKGVYTLVQINGLDTVTIKAYAVKDKAGNHTEIEINDIRH